MPTFILDRQDIYKGYSHEGSYVLTENELIWFKKNYEMISAYNYQQYVKKYSGNFEYFYKHGNHSDYFLYKKKINSW